MKNLFFTLLALLSLSSFTTKVESQGNPELIVAFEKYTPKLAEEFDAAISSLQGIRKIGGCPKMNVVYFSYDSSIYKSHDYAYNAIELATKRFNPLLKIGSTSAEVERACDKN